MKNIEDQLRGSLSWAHWEEIHCHPKHGFALSLASLHSEKSCGIGEFYDLIPLIDWCHDIGFQVIQLLPLNDSGSDASCYNALSSLALNPIYISLHALPYLEDSPLTALIASHQKELMALERFHYDKVRTHKLSWLSQYFSLYFDLFVSTDDYKAFLENNPWLTSYGLFKVLKDELQHTSFLDWPKQYRSPSLQEYEQLTLEYKNKISFYIFLQYLCFSQLKYVKEYANKRFVYLKGDIPILISRDSVDVWEHPELFDITLAAGAPPDAYSQEGQYWGFPIYRWEMMRKKNFEWWLIRLEYAGNFYNLYRIDHVIGFFRIWAIPLNHSPKEGFFLPVDRKDWYPQGKELLSMMLNSTRMLPIAEDLGLVPQECELCLNELGICGTKVMRWEKRYNTDNKFTLPEEYPPLSMTCVSTHDSETLGQWWEKFPDEANQYCQEYGWDYKPALNADYRTRILWQSHHTSSLFHINLLHEYLALFEELVWQDPDSERINIPGTVSERNWTYRMRPSVEEIINHTALKSSCVNIISKEK